MASTKKNIIYQSIYQLLIMILPLITSPYISRILGAEGLGSYSYSYSVANYFVLFAMLGINNYGNREIARIRDNKQQLSTIFCNMFVLHFLISLLVLVIYGFYCYFIAEDTIYALISIFYIIGALFDINWFFWGIEEFRLTVTRNVIVKIISVILIFLCVKTRSDLWKYILIMGVGTCISQSIVWLFIKKYIILIRPTWSNMIVHIKPLVLLFIPVIAVSIYRIMDKIMLGVMSELSQVGFYENADKIVRFPLGLITAFGAVMLPKISNLNAKGNLAQIETYLLSSMQAIMWLTYALAFGLAGIAPIFAPVFWGKEFIVCGRLIMFDAITLPFLAFSDVLRTQYLIPFQKDYIFIYSVICGAIVNVIANICLIPRYEALGAMYGTVFSEITVCLFQVIALRKLLPIKKYIFTSIYFVGAGMIMFFCVLITGKWLGVSAITLVVEIMLGIILYLYLTKVYIKHVNTFVIGTFYKKFDDRFFLRRKKG